jgi:colanic acid biosynthesis glycosyl transferase WcaI
VRILILTQYYPPEIGAAQARLSAFAYQLGRRGHSVEVVTAMPHHLIGRTYEGYRRKFYIREILDGVTVHRTWLYAATGTGLRRMLNYLSFTVTCIFGLLRARRPDLIFVESPPLTLGISGWFGSVVHRVPLVFNVSDLWPDSVRELGVMRDGFTLRAAEGLESWIYRRATIVNAVTDGIASSLRSQKAVPPAKLRLFPNGVDVDRFSPGPPDERLREHLHLDDCPVLLYAGTHGIVAGLPHVLDAAILLAGEAIVVFVGAGPVKPMLIARARNLEVKNVRFVDPVPLDEMPSYYSIATAAIVPAVRSSARLGMRPAKLFPAFSCGIPVIYSGEGEGADLVRQVGAGVVVPPEDATAIAQGMRGLIADPDLSSEMGRNGRKGAVERFAWSMIVDSWLRSIGAAHEAVV